MISSKKNFLNIALVGCGRISRKHISAINFHHDRCKLVALCDPNNKNLKEASENIQMYKQEKKLTYETSLFDDYKKLISSSKNSSKHIDLVVLATPSGFHSQQVIAAAESGLNICTEKPMATRFDDGLKMLKICKKSGVKLFVVKQNRCNSTLKLLKKQIDSGRFGKIYMVACNVFWQRPQSYYDQDSWRGTWKYDGGALMNQASHYVDLIEWLIGSVDSVNASIATLGRNIEAEDTAVVNLKWEKGTLGTMAVTMLTYPENLEGSITIIGENGTVRIGGKAVNQIEEWSFKSSHSDDEKLDEANYAATTIYGFGHNPYYKNMLDCLEGKSLPICDGESGLSSLKLIQACYISAKEGRNIDLKSNFIN